MTITFHPDGRVEGSGAGNFGSGGGNIIQTVVGTNGETSNNLVDLTGSLSSPTFLNSNCTVTITPKRSNSKILLTWSAQLRVGANAYGFVGVYYSPNSNMSSPTVVEKGAGPNTLTETYRSNDSSNTHWSSWSRIAWDETISSTSTRYYNVGGYAGSGNIYYGDNGLALQIMAQEISA
tara:strand:- start:1143 stop:1676 length:534 start_codon:yes stop_codon:yes gene_type:complete